MNERGDQGLETLQVWQKALALATRICHQTLSKLPPEEKWALAGQLRRAAQSVPANIAEGYGRYYYQDSVRYCYIARGSLEETFSHLALASNLNYLEPAHFQDLAREIREIRMMLNGYIHFLKNSKRGVNEPGSAIAVRDDVSSYETEIIFPASGFDIDSSYDI